MRQIPDLPWNDLLAEDFPCLLRYLFYFTSSPLSGLEERVSSAGLKTGHIAEGRGLSPASKRTKVLYTTIAICHLPFASQAKSNLSKDEDRRSNLTFANYGLNFLLPNDPFNRGHNVSPIMARSLHGLIRHLVDHIALCGEHGNSTRFSPSSVFELPLPCISQSFRCITPPTIPPYQLRLQLLWSLMMLQIFFKLLNC